MNATIFILIPKSGGSTLHRVINRQYLSDEKFDVISINQIKSFIVLSQEQ